MLNVLRGPSMRMFKEAKGGLIDESLLLVVLTVCFFLLVLKPVSKIYVSLSLAATRRAPGPLGKSRRLLVPLALPHQS